MFVFLMLFTYFAIPKTNQSKVLGCGIAGVVAFKFLFVVVGRVKLINSFSWITYILEIVLIYTPVKMIFKKNEKIHPDDNNCIQNFEKLFRFKYDTKINKLFVVENNILYTAYMLCLCLLLPLL
jgi:tellurite resistance protein TerC